MLQGSWERRPGSCCVWGRGGLCPPPPGAAFPLPWPKVGLKGERGPCRGWKRRASWREGPFSAVPVAGLILASASFRERERARRWEGLSFIFARCPALFLVPLPCPDLGQMASRDQEYFSLASIISPIFEMGAAETREATGLDVGFRDMASSLSRDRPKLARSLGGRAALEGFKVFPPPSSETGRPGQVESG